MHPVSTAAPSRRTPRLHPHLGSGERRSSGRFAAAENGPRTRASDTSGRGPALWRRDSARASAARTSGASPPRTRTTARCGPRPRRRRRCSARADPGRGPDFVGTGEPPAAVPGNAPGNPLRSRSGARPLAPVPENIGSRSPVARAGPAWAALRGGGLAADGRHRARPCRRGRMAGLGTPPRGGRRCAPRRGAWWRASRTAPRRGAQGRASMLGTQREDKAPCGASLLSTCAKPSSIHGQFKTTVLCFPTSWHISAGSDRGVAPVFREPFGCGGPAQAARGWRRRPT